MTFDPRFAQQSKSNNSLTNLLTGPNYFPHNSAAEMDVLSIIAQDTPRLHSLQLEDRHFFDPRNRTIFEVIQKLSSRLTTVTVADVIQKLNNGESLEEAGGQGYIIEVIQNTVPEHRREDKIIEVENCFKRRLVIQASVNCAKRATSTTDTDGLQAFMNTEMSKISKKTSSVKEVSGKEALSKFRDRIKLFQETGVIHSVKFDIRPIDDLFKGQIIKGMPQYIVFGAAPSTGKTALVGQMFYNLIRKGEKVFFCSVEMNPSDIIDRIVSYVSCIPLTNIRLGDLSPRQAEQADRIYQEVSDLIDQHAEIFHQPFMTVEAFEARALAFKAKHGRIDFAAIDYLQLFEVENRKIFSDYEKVTYCSRYVKAVTQRLSCPVFTLVQLTLPSGVQVPEREHIRGSKQVDMDADVVILMHARERDRDGKGYDTTHLNMSKGRSIGINDLDCRFTSKFMKFEHLQGDWVRDSSAPSFKDEE